MLVKEWMAVKPIVIDENTSIMKVTQIMKEHGIRRVPVVRRNRLVGIVSDRDIKEAAPSKATSLDMHELYYLLSEIKVKDIMTPNPITLRDTDSVEKAAVIMLKNRISGLPVVDEQGFVTGMITQTDVFKVMISITGIYRGPIQLACDIEDQTGVLHQLLNIIRFHKARIISVLTSVDHVAPGRKEAYIRIMNIPDDKLDAMVQDINKTFKVIYVTREDVIEIPQKETKVVS
jgi:acetoin utilization protein AcuB